MLSERLAKLRLENEQLMSRLKDSAGLLVELDQEKAAPEALQQEMEAISTEIAKLEKRLSDPPRVTLVQPAVATTR